MATHEDLTTPELLKGIHHIDVRIDGKLKEMEGLTSTVCRVTQVMGDPVTGSKGKTEDAIVALLMLQEELKQEIIELTELKRYITSQIDQVENAILVQILYARYVNGETFEAIAVSLNLSYRQVMRLNHDAVEALERVRQVLI